MLANSLPGVASLGEVARRATVRLCQAGFARPRHEALRLIGDRLGLDPGAVILEAERQVPTELELAIADLVSRRVQGEPLAYIAGVAGFRTLVLAVDHRVLIPRPETEGLVELAMARVGSGVAADIGVGSGAIALSLRVEGQFSRVLGVDSSREALQVASANRDRLRLGVDLVRGDLVSCLAEASVDLLVSNPPYVAASEASELDRGVREFEPAAALFGGDEGSELTGRLLVSAFRVVRPDGWICLELAAVRAERTAELARAGGWSEVTVANDLFGRPRYLTARRPR